MKKSFCGESLIQTNPNRLKWWIIDSGSHNGPFNSVGIFYWIQSMWKESTTWNLIPCQFQRIAKIALNAANWRKNFVVSLQGAKHMLTACVQGFLLEILWWCKKPQHTHNYPNHSNFIDQYSTGWLIIVMIVWRHNDCFANYQMATDFHIRYRLCVMRHPRFRVFCINRELHHKLSAHQ